MNYSASEMSDLTEHFIRGNLGFPKDKWGPWKLKRQGHTVRKGPRAKGIMFEEKLSWRKGSKKILAFGVWNSHGLGS